MAGYRTLRLALAPVLASLAVAPISSAHGSGMTLTGGEFLEACTRPDSAWINFCNGYVQAVFDGASESANAICAPAGLTRAKIVGAVVDRLTAAPELQEFNAALVVHAFLIKAYPCP